MPIGTVLANPVTYGIVHCNTRQAGGNIITNLLRCHIPSNDSAYIATASFVQCTNKIKTTVVWEKFNIEYFHVKIVHVKLFSSSRAADNKFLTTN